MKYTQSDIIQVLIHLTDEGKKFVDKEEVLKSLGLAVDSTDAWAVDYLLRHGAAHDLADLADDGLEKALSNMSPKLKKAYEKFEDVMEKTVKPYFDQIEFSEVSYTLDKWKTGMTAVNTAFIGAKLNINLKVIKDIDQGHPPYDGPEWDAKKRRNEIQRLEKENRELLGDTGRNFLDMVEFAVGLIPFGGLYTEAMVNLAKTYFEVALGIYERHNNQIEEALGYLNALNDEHAPSSAIVKEKVGTTAKSKATVQAYHKLSKTKLYEAVISRYPEYKEKDAKLRQTIDTVDQNTNSLNETFSNKVEYYNRKNPHKPIQSKIEYKTSGYKNGQKEIDKAYDVTQEAANLPQSDPLMIDLNGDGVVTTTVQNGIYFDLDHDGVAEKTAWASREDGVLVLDRNGNGTIDNGSELFGDRTVLSNGRIASGGIEALSEFDTNHDKKIDQSDSIYQQLKVWQDTNQDGLSQADELLTLEALGIRSLNLLWNVERRDDASGNHIVRSASYTKTDGSNHELKEYLLQGNYLHTRRYDVVDIDPEINRLPELQARGVVRSLRQAMQVDTSNTLRQLVESFVSEQDVERRAKTFRTLLAKWADSSGNARGTRETELFILDQFTGGRFVSAITNRTTVQAYRLFYQAYHTLYRTLYAELMIQTHFKPYITIDLEDWSMTTNVEKLIDALEQQLPNDDTKMNVLREAATVLLGLEGENGPNYLRVKEHFERKGGWYAREVNHPTVMHVDLAQGESLLRREVGDYDIVGSDQNDQLRGNDGANDLYGGAGHDTLHGEDGSDYLVGGSGNDTLYGGNDDDLLEGSSGNDRLEGGVGNDTYVFRLGDGHDTILDSSGLNVLRFGEGITPNRLFSSLNGSNVTLFIEGTDDQLEFVNARSYQENRQFTLVFADGTRMPFDHPDSPFTKMKGTDGNETLSVILSNQATTIHAGAGDDRLYGGSASDTLHGGTGNDYLEGRDGDDLLDGGAGNDRLEGDNGNDTYVFGIGYGHDTILDTSGLNVLQFAEGVTPEMIRSYASGSWNVVLEIEETGDKLEIMNFKYNDRYRQFTLEFADGTKMAANDPRSPFVNIRGTKQDEHLYTYLPNEAVEIHGGAGNDRIYGDSGSDTLYGESGNDYLEGRDGDDLLDGGAGNDRLEGDNGNDTYVFGLGYGHDTILDSSGLNVLRFGEGITPEMIRSYASGSWNVVLEVEETSDKLEIVNFKYSDSYRQFTLVFADGTRMPVDHPDSPFTRMKGTAENETLSVILSNQATTIHAGAGDDRLYGGSASDTLYGGLGNDYLEGRDGDDLLDGGAGNDRLEGDNGNDTYVFGIGYGHDTVLDTSGLNVLRFAEGVTPEMIRSYASGSWNVILEIIGTADKLEIINFRMYDRYRQFTLEFADGTKMATNDPRSPFVNIFGTEQDEHLYTYLPNDAVEMHGGAGNDRVYGSSVSDKLYGGSGNDYLEGRDGDDLLDGGSGNDRLEGDHGNDTYVFGLGYGHDTILDSSGLNVLRFGEGITPEMIRSYASGSWNVILEMIGTADKLEIINFRMYDRYRQFTLEFADGTKMAANDPRSPFVYIRGSEKDDHLYTYLPDEAVEMHGGAGNDRIYGNSRSDKLYGGIGNDHLEGGNGTDRLIGESGNDKLYGDDGDDVLDGGIGNDYLSGGSGNDTYLFELGDGQDTIFDYSGLNVLRFGDGITLEMLTSSLNGSNVILAIEGTSDQIELNNANYSESYRQFTLEFADGTRIPFEHPDSPFTKMTGTPQNDSISVILSNQATTIHAGPGDDRLYGGSASDTLHGEDGNDTLNGRGGDDVLDGGVGNDRLEGDSGNDTYVFGLGYGHDTILDSSGLNVLRFGEGITPEMVRSYASGSWNVVLEIEETGDKLEIVNFKYSDRYRQFTLEFADGTKMAANDPRSPFVNIRGTDQDEHLYTYSPDDAVEMHGGAGNDRIYGSSASDTLYGGSGNDYLEGRGGDDVLDGGAGNDRLEGDSGNDTYVFGHGYGHDTILDSSGLNVLRFGEGITPEMVRSYTSGSWNVVLEIEETGDKLEIMNFRYSDRYRQFTLEFADQRTATIDPNTAELRVTPAPVEHTSSEMFSEARSGDEELLSSESSLAQPIEPSTTGAKESSMTVTEHVKQLTEIVSQPTATTSHESAQPIEEAVIAHVHLLTQELASGTDSTPVSTVNVLQTEDSALYTEQFSGQ